MDTIRPQSLELFFEIMKRILFSSRLLSNQIKPEHPPMKLITTLTLALFVISCGSDSDTSTAIPIIENPTYLIDITSENAPITYEPVGELNLELNEDEIATRIYELTTDNEGNIYFIDGQLNKLISFDSEGNLRFAKGQKGRGPGDFEFVLSTIYHNGQIYVSNISGSRIDRFNLDGTFVNSLNVTDEITFPSFTASISDKELVLSTVRWGALGLNLVYAELHPDSIQLNSTVEVNQASSDIEVLEGMNGSAEILILEDGSFISGHLSEYNLSYYTREGTLTKVVKRDLDTITPPGFFKSERGSMMGTFGGVRPKALLRSGHLLVQAQWPTNVDDPNEEMRLRANGKKPDTKFKSSLDLYSAEGKLLHTMEFDDMNPDMGRLLHIDDNDVAYFLRDEESPIIAKYQIKVAG